MPVSGLAATRLALRAIGTGPARLASASRLGRADAAVGHPTVGVCSKSMAASSRALVAGDGGATGSSSAGLQAFTGHRTESAGWWATALHCLAPSQGKIQGCWEGAHGLSVLQQCLEHLGLALIGTITPEPDLQEACMSRSARVR